MGKFSRRAALTAGAVIPFSQWLGSQAWAQGVHIRRDLSTPVGNTDLLKYQHGVQLMKQRAETDPLNWEFWWYIHAVRNDRTKAGEIARIWGASSPPAKALAQQTWSTCQAHFDSSMEDYFLPWHRMYVYFFEAVLRNVLYDPSFSLPYWRYTQPSQRALPALFRNTASSLYSPYRNGPVNAGTAIDQGLVPTPINTASLAETSYRPSGGDDGFCMGLDFNLHGSVHVLVGNGQGMGSVPWAARDAIFWMHHCNIDRMWASWNHNGGCNPTDGWLNQTFVFPDGNGNQVVAKVSDFNTIAQRGYAYDTLEPGPHVGTCNQLTFNLGSLAHLAVLLNPIIVGPGPVEVKLQPPPEALRNLEALKKVPGLAAGAPPQPRKLILHDLSANVDPGVLYAVTVRGAAGGPAKVVGYINFFESTAHAHEGEMKMQMAEAERPRFYSFDVSRALAGVKGTPIVGIRPVRPPNPQAKAVIGGVRLVA